MTSASEPNPASQSATESVQLPSPTLWPPLLALGIALGGTGLVTNHTVAEIGGVLALGAASAGFYRFCRASTTKLYPSTQNQSRSRYRLGKSRALQLGKTISGGVISSLWPS